MPLAQDLLPLSLEQEKKKHKNKQLIQRLTSHFMDVTNAQVVTRSPGFSASSEVLCVGWSMMLCQPTRGKAALTEGSSFTSKQQYDPHSRLDLCFLTESLKPIQ